MNLEDFKDPAIVAMLFFVASSDWFDSWIKELFPSLNSTNPIVFTIIKTVVFSLLYWLYHVLLKKKVVSQ